jgi:hypothetical protein
MDILALDLSKSGTGWARYRKGDAAPTFGTWVLGTSYTDRAAMTVKLYQNLRDQFAFAEPDFVIYESPLRGDAQSTEKNNRIAGANAAIVEFVCKCSRIRFSECDNNAWKASFFNTNIPKRVKNELGRSVRNPGYNPKAISIAMCKAFGIKVQNDNEADAIGLLDHALGLEGIIPAWRAEHVLTPVVGVSR